MLTNGRCAPLVSRSCPAKPGWRWSTSLISSRSVAPSARTLRSPPTVGRNMDGTRTFAISNHSAQRRNRRTAERLVVDELVDRRIVAAQRAIRIARDPDLSELHAQAIEQHQPVHQWVAQVENELDRLDRLDRADDATHRPEHARLGAAGHRAWRWRRGKEAPIAALAGQEHIGAPLKAEQRAVHKRLLQQVRGVIDEVAGREVV